MICRCTMRTIRKRTSSSDAQSYLHVELIHKNKLFWDKAIKFNFWFFLVTTESTGISASNTSCRWLWCFRFIRSCWFGIKQTFSFILCRYIVQIVNFNVDKVKFFWCIWMSARDFELFRPIILVISVFEDKSMFLIFSMKKVQLWLKSSIEMFSDIFVRIKLFFGRISLKINAFYFHSRTWVTKPLCKH